MTATIIKFPTAAERNLRLIFAALARKPADPAAAIARALDRQAGRAPMGMFAGAKS